MEMLRVFLPFEQLELGLLQKDVYAYRMHTPRGYTYVIGDKT